MKPGPLIIIGAPRSGTNMLRDLLCGVEGMATWPCDELPYMWRYGNSSWPDDEIPPARATEAVCSYIRGCFDRRQHASGGQTLVEKTCANSLRVPFVDRACPDARYVFIHRNGIDAAASAARRWTAAFDPGYTLRKLRFVPLADIPRQAIRFVGNRLYRRRSGQQRLAWWGPKPSGTERLDLDMPVVDMAAWQWNACAARAALALGELPGERVCIVQYEQFVADPDKGLRELLEFADIHAAPNADFHAGLARISTGSVGKGQQSLDAPTLARLTSLQCEGRDAIADLVRSGTTVTDR